MKNITLLLLFLVIQFGCIDKYKKYSYNNFPSNKLFPDSLITHFPNEVEDTSFVLEYGGTNAYSREKKNYKPFEMNIVVIMKLFKIKSEVKFEEEVSKIKDESIDVINCKLDTNYFIISQPSFLYNRYDTSYLKYKFNHITKDYLILDFNYIFKSEKHYIDSSTICGLDENYSIYILNYGLQNVLKRKTFIEWDILPEKLKHGYTCGVGINRKEMRAIYWIVGW